MKTLKLNHESSNVTVHFFREDAAWVAGLYSRVRNKGHASALMEKLIQHADENGIHLYLDVQRFGHPIGPDNAYLVEFYKKFGFEVQNPRGRMKKMVRVSQKSPAI